MVKLLGWLSDMLWGPPLYPKPPFASGGFLLFFLLKQRKTPASAIAAPPATPPTTPPAIAPAEVVVDFSEGGELGSDVGVASDGSLLLVVVASPTWEVGVDENREA